MNFAEKLLKLRALNWSDIEIAEELSKISGETISRQNIYNWRTGARENPAKFMIGIAILKLYDRVVLERKAREQAKMEAT
jgi:hypothetical protein